jgi:hypothetical protein
MQSSRTLLSLKTTISVCIVFESYNLGRGTSSPPRILSLIHAQKASWRSTCEGEARQEATTVEGSAILHYGSPCIAHHLEWRVSEAVAAHDAFHDYSEIDVDDGISMHLNGLHRTSGTNSRARWRRAGRLLGGLGLPLPSAPDRHVCRLWASDWAVQKSFV